MGETPVLASGSLRASRRVREPAYVYYLSETTAALYHSIGIDTSVGSNAFRFWYADTYGGAWTQDTTCTATVVAQATAPWALVVRVSGITKDLPGGLGGAGGGSAAASDDGHCVLSRWGLPAPLLGWIRSLRDLCLSTSLGRILSTAYYSLAG